MRKTILVTDDEQKIVDLLVFNLERNGYRVLAAYDGQQALDVLNNNHVDCVILDIMMPVIGGIEACRIIRSTPKISSVPIIMLTAKGEEVDKVIGLSVGADDYMTKPFSMRELFARIDALLRRSEQRYRIANNLESHTIQMDLNNISVKVQDKEIDLSPTEFEILKLFLLNQGEVVSRNKILNLCDVEEEDMKTSRVVDVHVSKLRKKISDAAGIDGAHLIKTVRGIGFKLND